MKKLVPLLFLLGIVSCKPAILFTEPQPSGKRDLASFPARYHGRWMKESDSSILVLATDHILEKYREDIAESMDELLKDEDIVIRKGQLWSKELNMGFPVEIRNDSVFGTAVFYDTLVNLAGRDHLRKMGRYHFISIPWDTGWMVFKIRMKRKEAWMHSILTEQEIKTFREHTTVLPQQTGEGAPENYLVDPGPGEFRKLLRDQTFTDTTHYVRLPDRPD